MEIVAELKRVLSHQRYADVVLYVAHYWGGQSLDELSQRCGISADELRRRLDYIDMHVRRLVTV